MSDRLQSDESLIWGVDWAAYKTWAKFVAISALVAAVVLGCNLLAVAGLRLVAQLTRSGDLPANFELWNVGGAFPFLLELTVFLTPWLVFVILLRLFARRTSSVLLPGDFPMEVFESSRSQYSGWWMLIVFLYLDFSMLYSRLDPEFILLMRHNYLTHLFYTLGMILLGAPGIRVLFGKVLAEKRSSREWQTARDQWNVRGPGLAIGLLAAVALLASFLMGAGGRPIPG